jgi:MFS family permease
MLLLHSGGLARGIAGGCLAAGAPVIALGVWAATGPAIGLLVVMGVGFGLLEIAVMTLTQRLASDDVLGRVYGVQETVFVIATGLGSLLGALLAGVLGGTGALIATGAALPVLAVVLSPRLRALEAGAPVPERAFTLLRAVPAFAPLPIATVESLALRSHTEEFVPGARIIAQGEAGDRFYVIDAGTVDVARDGVVLLSRGEGEFFGEIALVHDVPRTATVTAATAVRVLVVGRDEFLAAIGAHPRSAHEINVAVAERRAPEPVA